MWPFNKKNRIRVCSNYTPRILAAKKTVNDRWYVNHMFLDRVFLDNWGEESRITSIDAFDWTDEEIERRISKHRASPDVPKQTEKD